MENTVTLNAHQIIEKIKDQINAEGIMIDDTIDQLLELRKIAIEKKQPRLARAIRVTTEHLDDYDGFLVPIPEEVELDEEGNEVGVMEQEDLEENEDLQKESLLYLLSLMDDPAHKANHEEIGEYIKAIENY